MAKRNKPPTTPPTIPPATAAFLVGAGPLLLLSTSPAEPPVCPDALGLPKVPDGLDPGIDIKEGLDGTAEMVSGEAILEMAAPELVAAGC